MATLIICGEGSLNLAPNGFIIGIQALLRKFPLSPLLTTYLAASLHVSQPLKMYLQMRDLSFLGMRVQLQCLEIRILAHKEDVLWYILQARPAWIALFLHSTFCKPIPPKFSGLVTISHHTIYILFIWDGAPDEVSLNSINQFSGVGE